MRFWITYLKHMASLMTIKHEQKDHAKKFCEYFSDAAMYAYFLCFNGLPLPFTIIGDHASLHEHTRSIIYDFIRSLT